MTDVQQPVPQYPVTESNGFHDGPGHLSDQNGTSFGNVLQRKLRAGFRILDTTSSGFISVAGFESMLQELMPALSEDDVRTLIECSGSCNVRYDDFVVWLYESELGQALSRSCSPEPGKKPSGEPGSPQLEEGAMYRNSTKVQNHTCAAILEDLAGQTDIVHFVQQAWQISKIIEKHVGVEVQIGESMGKEVYHTLGYWLDLLLRVADTETLNAIDAGCEQSTVLSKALSKSSLREDSRDSHGKERLSCESEVFDGAASDEEHHSDEDDDDDDDECDDEDMISSMPNSGLKGLDGAYHRPSVLYSHFHQTGVGKPSARVSYMVSRCGGGEAAQTALLADDEDSGSDCETQIPPMEVVPSRRNGVSAEAYGAYNKRRPFVAPVYEKPVDQRRAVSMGLKALEICKMFSKEEINQLVNALTTVVFEPGDRVINTGDSGDALFVVLLGAVEIYEESSDRDEWTDEKGIFIGTLTKGKVFGEHALLGNFPREVTVYAKQGGQSKLGRLDREVFQNFIVHRELTVRQRRLDLLRNVKMFEMMPDEQITQLCESVTLQVYEEGEAIIHQGEKGDELFIMQMGEAVVMIETGMFESDIQEHRRFCEGEVFGERSFLTGAERGASIIACTRVETLILSRRKFKRLFGSPESLQVDQYMTDPRKAVADFYSVGDSRGPAGTVKLSGNYFQQGSSTSWFAVYRPTSRDAIAKMLAGVAVGKGLNVKGKSAKRGVLSGLVPFVQISDNDHKAAVDLSPPDSRVWIFYKSEDERERAYMALQDILWELERRNYEGCEMIDPDIDFVDDYIEDKPATDMFGLDMPEALIREAYIMRPDITPTAGWETGRASVPAYMNMNLACLRTHSDLKVVLYQQDSSDPMNPTGLLIAYAEHFVKPVVSDFDTFLVGSVDMEYAALPEDQLDICKWSVEHTVQFVNNPNSDGWTTRWLSMLKAENERGFHPEFPKFGFGDPVSYKLVEDVCEATVSSGAVRHGAECFNFYFPQELDDQYLVVWEKFPDIPWAYKTEPELRQFLIERAQDGFLFPINPVWAMRDKGWYDVLQILLANEGNRQRLEAWWLPPDLIESVESLHKTRPDGFTVAGEDTGEQKISGADKAQVLLEAESSRANNEADGQSSASINSSVGVKSIPRKRITGKVAGGDGSTGTSSSANARRQRQTGLRRSRISEDSGS